MQERVVITRRTEIHDFFKEFLIYIDFIVKSLFLSSINGGEEGDASRLCSDQCRNAIQFLAHQKHRRFQIA
jgi:hypothetical protein